MPSHENLPLQNFDAFTCKEDELCSCERIVFLRDCCLCCLSRVRQYLLFLLSGLSPCLPLYQFPTDLFSPHKTLESLSELWRDHDNIIKHSSLTILLWDQRIITEILSTIIDSWNKYRKICNFSTFTVVGRSIVFFEVCDTWLNISLETFAGAVDDVESMSSLDGQDLTPHMSSAPAPASHSLHYFPQ